MSKYAVIVYKEVGKEPEFRKIEKSNEVFESLVGGEFDLITYDTYCIVFRKNQENLHPNIFLNTTQLGFEKTLKGTIFAINKDSDSNEYLTLNKEQALKCRKLFIDEAYKYTIYDVNGKYIGKKNRRNKNYNLDNNLNLNLMKQNMANNEINGKAFLEKLSQIPNIKLVPIKLENNTSKIDKNQNIDINSMETSNLAKQMSEQLNSTFSGKNGSDSEDDNDDFDRDTTLKLILGMQSVIIKWIKENYNE